MPTRESLRSWQDKLRGSAKAISRMEKSERSAFPSKAFADDYNRVRNALFSELTAIQDRFPPEATHHEEPRRGTVADFSFGEFLTYLSQLLELVNSQIENLEIERDRRERLERRSSESDFL